LAAEAKAPHDKLQAFFQAQEAWSKGNPYPREGDRENRKSYYEKRLQMLDEWIPQLPEEDFLRIDRLRALSEIPSSADALLVAEGEKAQRRTLRRMRQNPRWGGKQARFGKSLAAHRRAGRHSWTR